MDTKTVATLAARLANPLVNNAPLVLKVAGFSSAEARVILAALAVARSSVYPQLKIVDKILDILNLRYWKKHMRPETAEGEKVDGTLL